jgi:hypothetical protein
MNGAAFFLGTHQPGWLERLNVPLMVSHHRLATRRTLPRAIAPWVLDSGAFTQLRDHGRFLTPASEYAAAVRRYAQEIGQLQWASPMDWMCEPIVIAGGTIGRQRFVGTGLSVAEHQARTVASYLELRDLAPDLPWIPVLQGWVLADYQRCIDRFTKADVDLGTAPLVGLGSVCRRQATGEIGAIVAELAAAGLRLHGFGVKQHGLSRYADHLQSADSLAWSYAARRRPAMAGCTRHRNCANCPRYALAWRARVLAGLDGPRQLRLPVRTAVATPRRPLGAVEVCQAAAGQVRR